MFRLPSLLNLADLKHSTASVSHAFLLFFGMRCRSLPSIWRNVSAPILIGLSQSRQTGGVVGGGGRVESAFLYLPLSLSLSLSSLSRPTSNAVHARLSEIPVGTFVVHVTAATWQPRPRDRRPGGRTTLFGAQ